MKIKLVVATRESASHFFQNTATGRSIAYNKPNFLELEIYSNNSEGLPSLYNRAIKECADNPTTLVFAHDDLLLLDYFWCSRIKEGLSNFDIIGLAGNKQRVPMQPSWAFVDTHFNWDSSTNLSGVVGHGKGYPPDQLSIFGPPRQQVKLLDGLLIAAESETLIKNGLFFDETFDFHFYDLDFCRQAELLQLTCGTWDISLIHESGGGFGSDSWKSAYKRYIEKWKE